MNALIIEDEAFAAKRLENLVHEINPSIHIKGTLNSVHQATQWLNNEEQPDLIFLDIQLNDGYGFDILDQMEDHPPIIFTTAYNEFAIRGFKYNGLDYLLKPIVKTDLEKALAKFDKQVKPKVDDTAQQISTFKELFQKEYKKRFMVKVGNMFKSFLVEDIAYFKSHEGVICLYTKSGKHYPIEYTIDQLEEILNPMHFFRVNRKFLIALEAVEEIHTYFNSRLLLKINPKEEEQVIVSRERVSNFKKWLDM